MIEIEQRLAQIIRDMRESGLDKLSKASYNHAAKLTQNQTLLMAYRAKALMAIDGGTVDLHSSYDLLFDFSFFFILEETEKLLKEFENDSKLSESNPISLCPQVSVNGDDLVNLVASPDVKVSI